MSKYASKYVGAGSAPSGWTKIGNIAVDATGTGSATSSFTPGILDSYDNTGYVIISDTTTAGLVGRSTGGGTGTASANIPTYWVTSSKTDDSFISLAKKLTGSQSLASGSSAKTLLNNSGYWTSYSSGVITDGLVLNLDASDISSYSGSGTAWSDTSISSNIGVLMNGVGFTSSDGGALLFDGSNDYVNISNPINLNLGTSDFTISSWIYLNSLPSGESYPNGQWLFGTGPLSSITNTQIFIGASRLHFDLNTDNAGPIDVNHSFSINNWYNIVITRRGNTFSAYRSGNLLQTANSVQSAVNGYDWAIGRPEPTPSGVVGYFNGRISNFLVYNKSLSQEEVNSNYNNQKSRFGL